MKKALAALILGIAVPPMIGTAVDPFEDRPVRLWLKGAVVTGTVMSLLWAQQELERTS